uniref:Beta-lactamase n=1 Tax=Solibacter usitatus (strain Ellin6076) TaxID=234267 RepID=Q01N78_SOLUE
MSPSLAFLLLALAPAFAQNDTAARLARAFAAIDRAATASTAPGMVVGITDRTRTLKIGAYGYANLNSKTRITPETLFEIGSVSKSFTAISLMELFDEDRFDPQEPVAKYLPWFALKSRYRAITGHDLLTHTSGLQNYRPDLASMPFAALSLRDFEPSYAPGEHYWYSNLGFQVLGYVLEHIDAAKYDTIVQRRILNRLGMSATHAAIDDALRARLPQSYSHWPYTGEFTEEPWFEYLAADGSIASTAGDMTAYARLILNRGVAPSGRLLSERAFAQLTRPTLNSYAYGLFVRQDDGDTVIQHGGGIAGFQTLLEMHMQDGFGIIAMGNGGLDRELVQFAIASVKAALRDKPLPDPPARPSSAAITNSGDFAGLFSSGARSLEFSAAGNRLTLKQSGASIPLLRVQGDTFRVESGILAEYYFVFTRNAGKVTELSYGPDWYTSKAYTGPKQFDTPPEFAAYAGRYVNHNPEEGAVHVFVRKGQLFLATGTGPGQRLLPAGPATFRPGAPEFNPERISFDSIVEGHALRLLRSGMPMYRMDLR